MGSDEEPTPYADNALAHFDRGWAVFPAAPRGKSPLVKGRSGGYQSSRAPRDEVERELRRFARANVGIRLPEDMIALDIDLKADGESGEVLIDGADALVELGLPPTVSVGHAEDADGDPLVYRHFLYRVPEGVSAEDVARLGASAEGIDLIRWSHRLTLGRGSLHKSGDSYRWVTRGGSWSAGIPTPAHAHRLTESEWSRIVEFFGRSSGSGLYGVADVDVEAWLEDHQGAPSGALRGAFRRLWTDRTTGRHDAALRAVQSVAHLAEEGEAGAARVVARLQREFVEAVADRSSEHEAEEEFSRILASAIGKAVSKTESGDREAENVPEVSVIPNPRKSSPEPFGSVPDPKDPDSSAYPGGREDVPDDVDDGTIIVELGEEFSDTFVAMRVHEEWREKGRHVVYAPGLGWLRWTGKRWRPVADDVVADAVQKYVTDWFTAEVRAGCSNERRGRLNALMSKPRQERLVRALRVVEVVEATEFDRDPDLLNVQNGVVDLRTGDLLKHDPELRMTKICRVGYKPGARHPDWEKAKEALDPSRRAWLLGRFGQALTGRTPTDDKVVFLTGSGANGKSTFTGPVLKALGTYAALVPATLLLGASDRHPAELMTLLGVRFALAEETPEEGRINVQRLKQIAGVAELTARKMRQDFVTFDQTHSLFVTTNYPPNVVETDHGTWRRLARVVFGRDFGSEGEREDGAVADPTLSQRVVEDPEVWEAVLADLVRETVSYYERGRTMTPMSPEVSRDTTSWRSDMDPLVEFFGTALEADVDSFVSAEELGQAINEFLRSRAMHEWTPKTIAQRIQQHEGLGVRPVRERRRLNEDGYSARFVVSAGAKSYPVTVWRGIRWSK